LALVDVLDASHGAAVTADGQIHRSWCFKADVVTPRTLM
jgi:hypothetical protein